MIKNISKKPLANIILNGSKLNACPLRFRKRMSTIMTSIQHCTGSINHCNEARKRYKSYPDGKSRIWSLFIDILKSPNKSKKKERKSARTNN